MKINEHGYWEHNDSNRHYFDENLCKSIIEYLKNNNTKKIIDVGCGVGLYTKYILKNSDILCIGYDGNPNVEKLTNGLCYQRDFSVKQIFKELYDYVLCLEVAEHIPKKYQDVFLDNICKCSNKGIILSWAVEGQGGHGHVNEKNNEEVIGIFKKRNFVYNEAESLKLRNESTISWFKNTIMIFEKN